MIGLKPFVFRFSDVEVRESELKATRHEETLAIGPKAFRVLVCLLKRAGHVVPKNELLDSVWGDTAVTDNSLARAIAELRKTLEDDPHHPQFIETVSTVGYRFLCRVEVEEDADWEPRQHPWPEPVSRIEPTQSKQMLAEPQARVVSPDAPPASTPGSRGVSILNRLARRRMIASATGLFILLFIVFLLRPPLSKPRIGESVQLTSDGENKSVGGTDGRNVFFTRWDRRAIGLMPASGGPVAEIPLNLPGFDPQDNSLPLGHGPLLLDVSSDGTGLLVLDRADAPSSEVWVVDRSGSSAHYLFRARDATWAPNGRDVVYATGRGEIAQVPSEGGAARPLATLPVAATNYWPVEGLRLSPDGKIIRFARGNEFWEMASDGSGLHRILSGWRPSAWKCCGRWTADGRYYVFLAGDAALRAPLLMPGGQIWALEERTGRWRPRKGQPIQLTTGRLFWGPLVPAADGQSIFARGMEVRAGLVRYEANTREFRPFLGGISAEFVDFSANGNSLAYVTYPDGFLWRANNDGSARLQITKAPFHPKLIHWSPDGTRILFTDFSDSGLETAYLVSSSGGAPAPVLPEENGAQQDANWSPDGEKIVFSSRSDLEMGQAQNHEIRIFDLGSRKITSLPDSDSMYAPRWSPDGRYIAALTMSGEELKVFDLEEHRWSALKTGRFPQFPVWSKDSRAVYFVRYGEHGVFRVGLADRQPARIADLKDIRHAGWYGLWFGLDRDGAPLLLREEGDSEIYRLSIVR
jgi:DNA-binding winged helix-turn-helix (wHTH) protein/Tol biopolymer transport system component